MQSPPAEWALGITFLCLVDWIRDRGEPDGDTLTEVLRLAFHVHQPRGRATLATAIGAGGVLLYRHLVKPDMRAHINPGH